MLSAYVEAFTLTLAVEVPVYLVVLIGVLRTAPVRATVAAVGVNVATHPLVWWSLAAVPGGVPAGVFFAVEAAVCVAEWLMLAWWTQRCWTRRPGRSRGDLALLGATSVAANAASTLAGLLLLR